MKNPDKEARWGHGVLYVDRDLWLSGDGKVVLDAPEEGATVLASAFDGVPFSEVGRLGLDFIDGKVVQVAEAQAATTTKKGKKK